MRARGAGLCSSAQIAYPSVITCGLAGPDGILTTTAEQVAKGKFHSREGCAEAADTSVGPAHLPSLTGSQTWVSRTSNDILGLTPQSESDPPVIASQAEAVQSVRRHTLASGADQRGQVGRSCCRNHLWWWSSRSTAPEAPRQIRRWCRWQG